MESVAAAFLRKASIVFSVVLAMTLGLFVDTARAGHEGGLWPDSTVHNMTRKDLSNFGKIAAVHGRDQVNRSSGMGATFEGSGDVRWRDYSYGDTGWHGTTSCIDPGIPWTCDLFRIRLNLSSMGTAANLWRSLGCHEIGHTVRLDHRTSATDSNDNSCMRDDIFRESFDLHDLDVMAFS